VIEKLLLATQDELKNVIAENERLRDVLQEIADLYPLYRCDNPDVACEIAQEALKASDDE